jgi:glycosyltransferase involved in cell wall biosynthesis
MAELQRLGHHGHRLYGTLASLLEGHALARTNGVLCNSAYTKGLVHYRARKTWLVPNPIRTPFFQKSLCDPITDAPILLNVGLVTPRKRQLEILRGIRSLRRMGHVFKIVFCGGLSEDTEYGRQFTLELKAAEKEGFADFAGFLNVQDLVKLMDRSSGFIHYPSEEAFGLVVAEALARGLKFFGANLGGICDIVSDIPGTELHDTMESLCTGVSKWLADGAPRHPHAAAEIERRYHPQVIANRHIQIYREILGQS